MTCAMTGKPHRPYRPAFKDEKITWNPVLFEVRDVPDEPTKEGEPAIGKTLEYLVMRLCADCHLVYWEKLEPPVDLPIAVEIGVGKT